MAKILVAGATGYLGRFVTREFKERGDWVRVLARNPDKLRMPGEALAPTIDRFVDDIFTGEVTRPETLRHLCDGIDVVFSSVGITRQADPVTYMDVDYRGNKHLLDLAMESSVRKFLYVHIFNAHALQHLRNVRAKQRFVDELAASQLGHVVISPTGYFSDIVEVLRMAERGTAYVIGNARMNPIHGADLARVCVDAVMQDRVEVPVGGMDVYTYRQIAELAFEVLGKPARIRRVPAWLVKAAVPLLRLVGSRYADVAAGLATLTRIDCVAPRFGTHTLRQFFADARR